MILNARDDAFGEQPSFPRVPASLVQHCSDPAIGVVLEQAINLGDHFAVGCEIIRTLRKGRDQRPYRPTPEPDPDGGCSPLLRKKCCSRPIRGHATVECRTFTYAVGQNYQTHALPVDLKRCAVSRLRSLWPPAQRITAGGAVPCPFRSPRQVKGRPANLEHEGSLQVEEQGGWETIALAGPVVPIQPSH